MIRSTVLILGLCVSISIFARDYTITQITDNSIYEENPRLNEAGDVLWASWVNDTDNGWTLFLYDSDVKNFSQVSESNVFWDSHQLNIHGDAVWTGADDNGYQQIYVYSAATQSAIKLTGGDLHKTDPHISDTGDVAWMEVRGSTASNSGLMRYDGKTGQTAELLFPGATRQGLLAMNAAGDISWAATVSASGEFTSQDILLYRVSTGEIINLSNSPNALATNQRLLDNGDVLWHSTDYSGPVVNLFRHYNAANGTITDVALSGSPLFGPMGHAAWTTTIINGASTTYTISLYSPNSGKVKVISRESYNVYGVYAPILVDISARGDVIWHQIVQTNRFYRLYDAPSRGIFDIAVSSNANLNVFDYYLADNGDVITSEWDGNDYEVYTDQAANGIKTQLTSDDVDSGITTDNRAGSVVWNRWDYTDNELFVATKNPLSLTINRAKAEVEVNKETETSVKIDFISDGEPDYFESIVVKIDGVTLLNTTFGKFETPAEGKFIFKTTGVEATMDFNKGTLKATSKVFDPNSVDLTDGVDMEVSFGVTSTSIHAPVEIE